MTKQELNYAFDNGILDETQIALDIEMSKRKERLKAHPYDVWQGKDGKWRTYLPEPRSKTGRVQRVRNTREEIEDIISDYQKGLECSPTIREVFEDWNDRRLELEQISKATHNRNQVCFNRHFKDNAGDKIRSMDVFSWCDFLEEQIAEYELTAKAFANLKGITKGIIQRARRTGVIDYTSQDVFSELEDTELRFKRTKKSDSEEVFTEEEATLIKDHLQDNLDTKNMVLLLMFYSGIRVGEAVTLKQEDIFEDRLCINRTESEYMENHKKIHEVKDFPKTEAGLRTVVLPSNARWLIKKIKHNNPFGEYVFEDGGYRLTAPQIRKRLKRVCKEVGIPYRSTHKIRKTYVSILLDNHCDDRFVINQVGHTDIRTSEEKYHRNRRDIAHKQQILDGIADFG